MNSQSGARGPSDAERAAMSYDHRSQVRYVGEDFNASPGPNTSLWSRIKAKAPKIGSKSAVSQPCFSACHTHHVSVHCLHHDATRQHTQLAFVGMCAAESHNVFVVGLRRRTSPSLSHGPQQPHPCHIHPRSMTVCHDRSMSNAPAMRVGGDLPHCWCFPWVFDPATGMSDLASQLTHISSLSSCLL